MLPDLTALVALILGFMQMGGPRPDPAYALLGTAVCMLISGSLTRMSLGRGLRALDEEDLLVAEVSARWTVAWAFFGWVACLFFFHWGAWVNAEVPRMAWLGRYAVLFLPALILFGAAWAARARLEAEVLSRRGGIPPPSTPVAAVRRALKRNALFFLPLFIVIGLTDGIWVLGRLGVEPLRQASLWLEAMPLLNIGAVMVIVLATLPFVPAIFARMLKAAPMAPGRMREVLERAASSIDLRYREIRVWPTRAPNAMVVGFTPRSRTIFMTQGLLDGLTEDEVLAVFFHEAGHAKRRHLPLFIALFFALSLVFHLGTGVLQMVGISPELQIILHLAILWFVLLGFISRRFERESDVYGAEHAAFLAPDAPPLYVPGLMGPLPHGAALMMRALERVRSIAGTSYSHRHGSIEDRVSYVAQYATDPDVRSSFERGRRSMLLGIFAFIALAAVATVYSVPTEVAQAQAHVAAEDGYGAYRRAWDASQSKDAGVVATARATFRKAFDGFLRAAERLEGLDDPRSRRMRISHLRNAADTAIHGLRDAREGGRLYAQVLELAQDPELDGPGTAATRFDGHIELGRVAAWEQAARPMDGDARDLKAVRDHLQAARNIHTARLEGSEAFPQVQRDYFAERLRLLEATYEAVRGERVQAIKALKALARMDHGRSGWENRMWIEVAEDARAELERLGVE